MATRYFFARKRLVIVIALISLYFFFGNKTLGSILLILDGLLTYFLFFNPVKDSDIDRIVKEKSEELVNRALEKVGTDLSEIVSAPITITGPRFSGIGNVKVYTKLGKDELMRYSVVGVTILHFAERQLLAYECTFNLLNGKLITEGTHEYFYGDVVSMETHTRDLTADMSTDVLSSFLNRLPLRDYFRIGFDLLALLWERAKRMLGVTIKRKPRLEKIETFELTTAAGTAIRIPLPILANAEQNNTLTEAQAQLSIQSVRRMLRDRKIS